MADTSVTERFLAWDPRAGLVRADAPATAAGLLAADSWLVADGRVRGLDRHGARFARACADSPAWTASPAGAADGGRLDGYWRQVTAALPRAGAWFPRAELRPGPGGDAVLGLRLRPAPVRRTSVRALLWPHPDPRAEPGRKGPDLHRLAELRAEAVAAGADDLLLTTEDGALAESATASLLWWEADALWLPDAVGHQLPGVTAALIADEARRRGIAVRRRRVTLPDLHGREAWLVNALHGIQPVTAWIGTDQRPGPPERAPHWQRLLSSLARPLP